MNLPQDLAGTDRLTRFINNPRYLSLDGHVLLPQIFEIPYPKGFSVFKTTNLQDDIVWSLAKDIKKTTDPCKV